MPAAATPALAALTAAGVRHEVVKFGHDPRERSFGVEAVHALTKAGGIAAEQIYKTLIIAVPDGLAVAILPASSKLSLKAAAAALGVPKASMAEPVAAQRATAMWSALFRRSGSARRYRRSSTPARWPGTGSIAARAGAGGTSRSRPKIWFGSPAR